MVFDPYNEFFHFITGIRLLFVFGPVALLILGLILLYYLAKGRKTQQVNSQPDPGGFNNQQRIEIYRKKKVRHQEETRRILGMVAAGTISAGEGDKLLNTLERETGTMACPFCSEDIKVEAVKCKHCNQYLLQEMRNVKRLTKSPNCVISGVCAGIAEYLDMDPALIRIVLVLISLFTGIFTGIIIYVIAAIIMPDP